MAATTQSLEVCENLDPDFLFATLLQQQEILDAGAHAQYTETFQSLDLNTLLELNNANGISSQNEHVPDADLLTDDIVNRILDEETDQRADVDTSNSTPEGLGDDIRSCGAVTSIIPLEGATAWLSHVEEVTDFEGQGLSNGTSVTAQSHDMLHEDVKGCEDENEQYHLEDSSDMMVSSITANLEEDDRSDELKALEALYPDKPNRFIRKHNPVMASSITADLDEEDKSDELKALEALYPEEPNRFIRKQYPVNPGNMSHTFLSSVASSNSPEVNDFPSEQYIGANAIDIVDIYEDQSVELRALQTLYPESDKFNRSCISSEGASGNSVKEKVAANKRDEKSCASRNKNVKEQLKGRKYSSFSATSNNSRRGDSVKSTTNHLEFEAFLTPFPFNEDGIPENWTNETSQSQCVTDSAASTISSSDSVCDLIVLDADSFEYQVISAEFHHAGIGIACIERVQNHNLLKKYAAEISIFSGNRPSDFCLNEQYLFHGTRVDKTTLCEEGLDLRLSLAGNLGRGIYFSDNPRKCLTYSQKSGSSELPIILKCRVMLGDVKEFGAGVTRPDLKREPEREVSLGSRRFYDSVKGRPMDYNEFVIYESRRALIEYIITYNNSYSGTVNWSLGSAANTSYSFHEKSAATKKEDIEFYLTLEETKKECREHRRRGREESERQEQERRDREEKERERKEKERKEKEEEAREKRLKEREAFHWGWVPAPVTEEDVEFYKTLEETKKACRERRRREREEKEKEEEEKRIRAMEEREKRKRERQEREKMEREKQSEKVSETELSFGSALDRLLEQFKNEDGKTNSMEDIYTSQNSQPQETDSADSMDSFHSCDMDTNARAVRDMDPSVRVARDRDPSVRVVRDMDPSVRVVRDSLIVQFMELTKTDDIQIAQSFIDDNDMDFDKAIDAYFNVPLCDEPDIYSGDTADEPDIYSGDTAEDLI